MVKKDTTPKTNSIKHALETLNFTDTFSTTNQKDSIQTITHLIFGTMPKWVAALMRLRNAFVKVFGLKTELAKKIEPKYEAGEVIGFFKVFSVTNNEIILGANDKHLDFRVSIYNSKEAKHNIKVTTLVQYNNSFGKIYMAIIKPFHVFIVKQMVKQAYKI